MEPPEHLQEDVAALRRAYPDGVPDVDYPALLFLLSSEFAEGNVGEVVGVVARREPVVVVNDAAAVQSNQPSPTDVHRVRKLLADSGFIFEED